MLSNWILDFPVTEEENLHSNCPYTLPEHRNLQYEVNQILYCLLKKSRQTFCDHQMVQRSRQIQTLNVICNIFDLRTLYKYYFEPSIHYVEHPISALESQVILSTWTSSNQNFVRSTVQQSINVDNDADAMALRYSISKI